MANYGHVLWLGSSFSRFFLDVGALSSSLFYPGLHVSLVTRRKNDMLILVIPGGIPGARVSRKSVKSCNSMWSSIRFLRCYIIAILRGENGTAHFITQPGNILFPTKYSSNYWVRNLTLSARRTSSVGMEMRRRGGGGGGWGGREGGWGGERGEGEGEMMAQAGTV